MRPWKPSSVTAAATAACSRDDVHPPSQERKVKLLAEFAAQAGDQAEGR